MDFTKKDWNDLPAGGTPIIAAELDRIEQGIDDAKDEINQNTSDIAQNTSDIADKADDRSGITNIPSGAACVIDYSTGAMVYKHTVNQDVSISITNLPASGTWGLVLMLTNGGAYTVSYPADWKEEGGTALTLTEAGEDRLVITGEGQTATSVIISVVETDVK